MDVASTSVNAQTNIGLDHKEEVTIGKPRRAKKGVKGGKVRKVKTAAKVAAIAKPTRKISLATKAAILIVILTYAAVIDRFTGSHAQNTITDVISNIMKHLSNPQKTTDVEPIVGPTQEVKKSFLGKVMEFFVHGTKSNFGKINKLLKRIIGKSRSVGGSF